MKTRNRIKPIQNLLLLGMFLAITVLPVKAGQATNPSSTKERTFERLSKNTDPAIPPIDAAVPEEYETASFGLG